MKKKGVTLVEIVVAGLILSMAVACMSISFISIGKLLKVSAYQYVATNLARDVLEFGAAGRFAHWFKFRYYYNPTEGRYRLMWWQNFNPGNPHPFDSSRMGDILAKGLAPRDDPDDKSVVIYYEARQDPSFYNAYRHDVSISWEVGERRTTRELGVISITHVNDVLTLNTAEFSWE